MSRQNAMRKRFGNKFRYGSLILLSVLAAFKTAQAQALADPTRPAQYHPAAAQAKLNLQSILFGNSRRVAVINGKALTEGERIGGARILSISKDMVRLKRGDKIVRLKLDNASIRREK